MVALGPYDHVIPRFFINISQMVRNQKKPQTMTKHNNNKTQMDKKRKYNNQNQDNRTQLENKIIL